MLLFAAASLASCDVADTDRVAGVDLEAATILTEHTDTGTATLEDGEFRAPVAPGSASELVNRLSQWRIGDLDGGGLGDAAAITIEDPGGSGRFRYLHALLNEEGELLGLACCWPSPTRGRSTTDRCRRLPLSLAFYPRA